MATSERFSLNRTDWTKLGWDFLYFLIVPGIFYLTALLGTVQQPNHVITVNDLVPTNNTIVAIVAWILNQLLNLLKKYVA